MIGLTADGQRLIRLQVFAGRNINQIIELSRCAIKSPLYELINQIESDSLKATSRAERSFHELQRSNW